MEYQTAQPRLREFWELVAAQHGVVSRSQLLALGFAAQAIKRRVASGRLHRVRRGVYAVGRPELSREGRWLGAILACGHGVALSDGSAAALWEVEDEIPGMIELTVPPTRGGRTDRDLILHRRLLPGGTGFTTHLGIPVTSPAVTLIDIAARLPRRRLEAAVNAADKNDLIDPVALRIACDDHAGRRGVRALRELLDRHTFLLTDSELERRFVPIARRAGLPEPRTQQWVNGCRVDFHWPDLGLVVETDGLRHHRTPAQQTRDRLRDQTHTAAGLTPLRFTHAQIRYEPGHVEATLGRVAKRLCG